MELTDEQWQEVNDYHVAIAAILDKSPLAPWLRLYGVNASPSEAPIWTTIGLYVDMKMLAEAVAQLLPPPPPLVDAECSVELGEDGAIVRLPQAKKEG